MQKIPKSVRDRLQTGAAAVGHPDPDVLAAFVERSLLDHERAVVLEHLSRCSDCRDVLALALPPVLEQEKQPAADRPAWFAIPVLRWGVAVAGVVVISSVGFVHYGRRAELRAVASKSDSQTSYYYAHSASQSSEVAAPLQNQTARKETQPAIPKRESALAAASTPKALPSAVPRPSAGLARSGAAGAASAAGLAKKSFADRSFAKVEPPTTLGGPIVKKQFNSATAARQPSTNAFRGAAMAPAASSANQVAVNRPESQSEGFVIQAQSQPQDQLLVRNEEKVDKAKLPVTVQASAAAAPVPPAPMPLQTSPMLFNAYQPPIPIWTITASGGLQRSFDGGKSWHDVNAYSVAPVPSTPAEASAALSAPTALRETNKAAKSVRAMPMFRAVAAMGRDVWAGGSGTVLYHSTDAGEHWTRVTPSANSITLTGDVTALNFSDSQHGTIATSSGEVWTTTDGGQSWQKSQ